LSWADFLRWCSEPSGVTIAVGVALSYLAQYVPRYELLPPKWKRAVFLAVCLFIPLLAATIGAATGVFSWSWEPTYWGAIVAGFTAFASGTAAHTREL